MEKDDYMRRLEMISDDREKVHYIEKANVCLAVDAVASLFSDDKYRCKACSIFAEQHPCPPIVPRDAVCALAAFSDDHYRLKAAEAFLSADVYFDIVAVSKQFSDDRCRVKFLSAAPPPSCIRHCDPPHGSPYPPYSTAPSISLFNNTTIPSGTHISIGNITSGMVFGDSATTPVHPSYDGKDIQNVLSSIVVPEKVQVPKEVQCSICMERACDSAAVPCGHVFCCDTCAKAIAIASPSPTCPICRQPITTIMKLFKV
jgi:hypothetical protein